MLESSFFLCGEAREKPETPEFLEKLWLRTDTPSHRVCYSNKEED